MVVCEVKVLPLATESASISRYIQECHRVAEECGLKHQVTPTSTVLEGSWDEVMQCVQRMHQAPFDRGCQRVVTTITIDERHDKHHDMDDMVESVLQGTAR